MSADEQVAKTPTFETDTVLADRARDQGLGLGERELRAQGDPGGVRTANVDPELENGKSALPGEDLDESLGVQGAASDDANG